MMWPRKWGPSLRQSRRFPSARSSQAPLRVATSSRCRAAVFFAPDADLALRRTVFVLATIVPPATSRFKAKPFAPFIFFPVGAQNNAVQAKLKQRQVG